MISSILYNTFQVNVDSLTGKDETTNFKSKKGIWKGISITILERKILKHALTVSMWMGLLDKHVIEAPYCFSSIRPSFLRHNM